MKKVKNILKMFFHRLLLYLTMVHKYDENEDILLYFCTRSHNFLIKILCIFLLDIDFFFLLIFCNFVNFAIFCCIFIIILLTMFHVCCCGLNSNSIEKCSLHLFIAVCIDSVVNVGVYAF